MFNLNVISKEFVFLKLIGIVLIAIAVNRIIPFDQDLLIVFFFLIFFLYNLVKRRVNKHTLHKRILLLKLFSYTLLFLATSLFYKINTITIHFAKNNFYEITDIASYNQNKNELTAVVVNETKEKYLLKLIIENVKKINVGNQIYIQSTPIHLKSAKNPNQFDSKSYYEQQNIKGFIYGNFSNCLKISNKKIWKTYISTIQNSLSNTLTQHFSNQTHLSVLQALLLGNKKTISFDNKKDFAAAGAMHVLAVSGLHIGIVFLFMNTLLKYILPKSLVFIRVVVLLLTIWFYVIITGGSPSVLRAGLMFSLITIGLNLNRQINIYNIIAASAFILLLFNPSLLQNVSFQLSYLAIIGIIYLQRKIYSLWFIKNYILDKVWELSSVSIAAQIATFPISIYYFKQFPSYFIVSNLFVIPLVTLLLYFGIFIFTFQWWTFVSSFIAYIMEILLDIFLYVVQWIAKLPGAVITGIHISNITLFIWYAILISSLFYIRIKTKNTLYLVLFLFVLLLTYSSYTKFKYLQQKQIIVYHSKKENAIQLYNGQQAFTLHDTISDYFNNAVIINNQIHHHILDNHKLSLSKNYLIRYNDKAIYIIDNLKMASHFVKSADFLVINSTSIKPNNLNLKLLPKNKTLIFGNSISKTNAKIWEKHCNELNINCYFVNQTEAFTYNFK